MEAMKIGYFRKPVLLFLIVAVILSGFLGFSVKVNAAMQTPVMGIDGKKYSVVLGKTGEHIIVFRNDVEITTIYTGGSFSSDFVDIQTYSFTNDTLNISTKWRYKGAYQTFTAYNVSKIKDRIILSTAGGSPRFDFPRDSTQRQVKIGRKGNWSNIGGYYQHNLPTDVVNQTAYARAISSAGELMELTYTTPFPAFGTSAMSTESPDGTKYVITSLQLSAGTATIKAQRPDGTYETTEIYKSSDYIFSQIKNMWWSGNNLNVTYQWRYANTNQTATFYNLGKL
ncbi:MULTISPECIES: hypothetical protein [unclassified Paenibacillus]|uniref:hypothetical protein n=1 Tax=unclassified Paenibacillus TaxID=185978 RepID=UPI0025A09EA7|nr:hypothetical protein [Paenibacillus sp. S-12]